MSERELLSEYKQRVGGILRTQEYCEASSVENRRRIVEALTCPLQKIELFQYRGCSPACIAGLAQGSILFKVPMKFNDPFDSMICWRKDVVDRYFDDEKCGSVLAKLRLWDAECVALSLSNCFRISCFSEICSSPIMWAHYADNCRGFCVGYEMHPAFAEIIDIGSGQDLKRCEGSIFPVIYSNRRQDATQAMIREIEYAAFVQRPIKTQKIVVNWQDDRYAFDLEDCGEVPVPGDAP